MTREEKLQQFAEQNTKGLHLDRHNLIQMVKQGAEWADQHPHWIPVEERLPEHCDCLLYTEPRNIHGPFEGRFRFGFYNYADQRWEIQGEKWDNTIVTHWMPLPEAPRKEDKK